MALGLALLPTVRDSAALVIMGGLIAAGAGLVLPLLGYLASLRTHQQLGVTLGTQTAAASLGQAIGSAAAGWLFGVLHESSFCWYAALMAIAAVVAIASRDQLRVARTAYE